MVGRWCGVIWCGVIWRGVIWCGVIWCGVIWCGGKVVVLTWEDVDGASYSALSKYLRLLTGSDDTTIPPLQTQRMY